MKIEKMCKNEIIECESTSLEYIYVKKYYDLEGNLKRCKEINTDTNRIGGRFRADVKDAFEYFIYNEGYRVIIG